MTFKRLLGFATFVLCTGAYAAAGTSVALHDSARASDEFLPTQNFVLKSAMQINLTKRYVRMPIHRGSFHGRTYWYILTDVSDAGLAKKLGLNFAPKLANAPNGCPACVQVLDVPPDITMARTVEFKGVPDFSPRRRLVPSATGFPLLAGRPGSMAGPGYSPYVQVKGTSIVYNASIIASGTGPMDVMMHSNVHDRVMRINLRDCWADMLFIQAFSGGKEVIYLGLESSGEEPAILERSTLTPGLANLSFPNGEFRTDGARAGLFAFANGQTGSMSPPAQGLNHLILDGHAADEATLQNTALLEALRRGGDARNVTEVFPTMTEDKFRLEYSPAWDLHVVMWRPDQVASHANVAQTDAFRIRDLGVRKIVGAPGGFELASSGSEVNCPVIAFVKDPPLAPEIPSPVQLPRPSFQ